MSYKAEPRNKRGIMFYPNIIQVGKNFLSTGPYKKDLCGKTQEGVNKYLEHIASKATNQSREDQYKINT